MFLSLINQKRSVVMKIYKITINGNRADAMKLFDFLQHFLWENDEYDRVEIFYCIPPREYPLVILNERIPR